MIVRLFNFSKKIIFFFKAQIINYLKKNKKNFIKINNFFFIINIFKLIKDPNYAEKLISTSSYLNSRHLMVILKISEKVIRRKIIFIKKINAYNTEICDYYDSLARNLWYQGKSKSAIKIFDKEEKYRIKIKNYYLKNKIIKKQVNNNYYLPRNTIHVLGLIGHLDAIIKFIKLKKLNYKLNIIGQGHTVVNSFFFNLYKKYINFIEIKDNPPPQNILLEEKLYFKNFHWVMPSFYNNLPQICHKTFAETLLKWKIKKNKSLIRINNIENNFQKIKSELNIPKNKKYIVIHIRSKTYLGYHNKKADSFRSNDICNFEESINYLNSLGYYVILIGENIDETKINCNKRMLINYHKNSFRSEKNEVVLIKNCELFIGTNSGPHWIASSLGKKLCLINVPFNDGFPYYKDVIYLPLKYFKNNKIINIDHILKKYSSFNFNWLFDYHKIKVLNNNSQDILLTIKEFLYEQKIIKHFDLYQNFKNKINSFRNKFKRCNRKYENKINGKIAASYIVSNYSS
jgi:putative glycosyltransferase (TIGR04372 family)